MRITDFTRRDFIQTAAYATGAVVTAGGLFAPARLISAPPQSNRKLRWGLIGIGNRCRQHIKLIQEYPQDCEIVAICDIREEGLQRGRDLIGKPVEEYKDYREMLARADINTVLVTTPTYLHKEMVIASLRKGCDVLCEKPLGSNTRECNEIIDVWLRTDCVLHNGLQLRYHPLYQEVHKMVKDGAIGDLKFIWAVEMRGDWGKKSENPLINEKINYMYYKDQAGGTVNNKNCHDFDIFNWVIDSRAVRVCGFGGTTVYGNRDSMDHFTSIVEYENTVKVTMGLVLFNYGYHDTVLVGDKGKLLFQRGGMQITWTDRYRKEKPREIKLSDDPADIHGHRGSWGLYEEFLAAVKERRPTFTGPYAGRDTVRIADAIQVSIAEDRIVYCNEMG